MKKTLFLSAICAVALCGTVKGAEINHNTNTLLSEMANYGAGDSVTLNVTKGFLADPTSGTAESPTAVTYAADFDVVHFSLSDGYSRNYSSYNFTGAISGSGEFTNTKTILNGQNYKFTGDMSGYTGNMTLDYGTPSAEQTSRLILSGNTVGAATITTGSRMEFATEGAVNLNGTTVTAGKTVVRDGSTLNLNAGTTASLSNLSIGTGASIHVDAQSTLNMTSDDSYTVVSETARTSGNGFGEASITKDFGSSLVNNGGTITVNGSAATCDGGVVSASGASQTYYINDASADWDVTGATKLVVDTNTTDTPVALGDGVYNWSALDIKSGAVTTAHSNGTGFVQNGDITIGAGASLSVVGAHDAFGYDNNACTKSVTLNGAEGAQAQLILAQTTDFSVTMKTDLIMNGNAAVTGEKGFNTFGGSITVTGTDNSIEHIAIRNNVTVDVADGGTLTIGSVSQHKDAVNQVLTKTGAGTLTLTGAATLKNIEVQGGSLVLSEATTMTSLSTSDGGNVTLATADLAVTALTMKAGSTLTIGQQEESLVSVQTLTVNGAATLNANLELAAAATLHLDGTLTMGSTVELGEGITLEGNLLDSLLDGSTDSITLFSSVDALTLGGVTYSHPLYGYEVFSNPELGNTPDAKYVVSYNGSDVKLTVVPEPATATLSLLALAALAARRRRH